MTEKTAYFECASNAAGYAVLPLAQLEFCHTLFDRAESTPQQQSICGTCLQLVPCCAWTYASVLSLNVHMRALPEHYTTAALAVTVGLYCPAAAAARSCSNAVAAHECVVCAAAAAAAQTKASSQLLGQGMSRQVIVSAQQDAAGLLKSCPAVPHVLKSPVSSGFR